METEFLEINGITLLSTEEVEKIPEGIRNCNKWWWLRSPGNYSVRAVDVSNDGNINYPGINIDYDNGGVRPALIILELEDLDLEKFKDSVEIFGIEWIYIGDGIVLAENPIFESIFDLNSNNYETSEIKQKLKNWLEK